MLLLPSPFSTKRAGREPTKPQALGKSTRLLCLKLVLEVYHLHLNSVAKGDREASERSSEMGEDKRQLVMAQLIAR